MYNAVGGVFMRAVDIITKKRDGAELTAKEIDYFIDQ
jgi:thymidine phosphorylase